jgi:hypothetical protein
MTVKSFNDYLAIVFLHLSNLFLYPNEMYYAKYINKSIRIKPDDAMRMANKICKRMQEEFEDLIVENYPIKSTIAKFEKDEKSLPDEVPVKEIGKTKIR